MKKNIRFLVLSCLITVQPACAETLTDSAEPIEAWAIDAETKEPLEGVVVTANWQLTGGFEGGYPKGQTMVMETITDAKGRFFFPGWGPKMHLPDRKLREDQPQIVLFKPGFRYRILTNTFRGGRYSGKSEWNGKAIELVSIDETGDAKTALRNFQFLNSAVEQIVREPRGCNWKKIPQMLLAVQRQKNLMLQKGISEGPWGISSVDRFLLDNAEKFAREGRANRAPGQAIHHLDLPASAKCGSPRDFFNSYPP